MFGTDLVEFVNKWHDYIAEHPEIQSGIDYYEMTRDEKFRLWWRRYRHIMEHEQTHEHFSKNSSKQF